MTELPNDDPFPASVVADTPAEVVALEARLRRAQLDADVAALDALIDDDLLFAGPDGRLATKAADLAAHRDGAVRFRAHAPEALRARRVGGGVVVTSLRAHLEVDVQGTFVRGAARYTRVWARDAGGAWRVVAGQVSPVPDDASGA